MWIKVSYMAFIDNADLTDQGISLEDNEGIEEYFYEQGGEDTFHDHGLEFEIMDRSNTC